MKRYTALDDIAFHRRRAAEEHAAARGASDANACLAHRGLALQHEMAAYRATRFDDDLAPFDQEAFLRFVLTAAVPAAVDGSSGSGHRV